MPKQESLKDKEGYLLLPKEFSTRGFNFKFLKDLEDGWKIYEKSKENCKNKKYELIKPKRQDAFVFHGNPIEAKWVYPGDSSFGKIGFDCSTLQRAEEKHKEIITNKVEHSQETDTPNLKLPKSEFTIKDVLSLNNLKYSIIYTKIKEMILSGNLKKVGIKKNKRGKSSDVFKIN